MSAERSANVGFGSLSFAATARAPARRYQRPWSQPPPDVSQAPHTEWSKVEGRGPIVLLRIENADGSKEIPVDRGDRARLSTLFSIAIAITISPDLTFFGASVLVCKPKG